MKIYIVLEDHLERIIRFVTLSYPLAERIKNSFPHLLLFVEEYETIECENLKRVLEVKP